MLQKRGEMLLGTQFSPDRVNRKEIPGWLSETRLSRLTRLECSPRRVCTVFLGLAPVCAALEAPPPAPDKPESRSFRSKGFGELMPAEYEEDG